MKISNEAVTSLVTSTWVVSPFAYIKLVQVFAFRRISSEWFRASNFLTFLHDLSRFDDTVLINFNLFLIEIATKNNFFDQVLVLVKVVLV